MSNTYEVKAWGAPNKTAPLDLLMIPRRVVGPTDVTIEVAYCGICHSDYHTIKGDWAGTKYNCCPGHEIIGKVVEAGSAVTKFKVGDTVGVGCMVDSCRECDSCKAGLEQFCQKGMVGTYNSDDKHIPGQHTYGGYSTTIVVTEEFVLRIPESLDIKAAAPLLCAGITTYSPLRHKNIGPGSKVGVVGLGGLGHMGIKLAAAMGAEVTIITTSESKVGDAKRLGAAHAILSRDPASMAAAAGSLDFILDCVSADHDVVALLSLLKTDGHMTFVGAPEKPLQVPTFALIFGRKSMSGSLIGGIAETQEMLDFCAKHNILPDTEMIPITKVNEAYERMLKSDVKYRFVIDMQTLRDYSA